MLRYHRFDPAACGFPRPRVPVLPPLTWAQIDGTGPADGPELRHYARGRYALHAAYALAGVGPKGALLAPAYHCRTMLDGALRLGAEVALYPLTAQLEPDPAGLERALANLATPAAALLFTHYFGLPRAIEPVAAWCRARGIALVEDCSHALAPWPGATGDSPMGRTGRYAVSSPYKFQPCPDGGLLWSPEGAPLPPATPSPGWRAELRGAWHALQSGRRHAPAPLADAIEAELQPLAPRFGQTGRDWIEDAGAGAGALSPEYATRDERCASLAVSRWIRRHTDASRDVRLRRERYTQWADAVRGLPGCRALFPELPPASTPYMFPLLVDDPPRRFYPLKQLGVPIWRWDDMAVSDCPVSQRYRQGVFHLPVHQALDEAQMQWMTTAVARAMRF